MRSSSWNKLREDFPITKKYSYLANAAISPIPSQVRSAVLDFYKENMLQGGTYWRNWIDCIEEARQIYASFIGARSSEIAFTHSTSEGMNIVAHLLAHRGHAISNDLEFPSSNLPWINMGADMTVVRSRSGTVPIDHIQKAIGKRTRTIITSHVQYSTGFKQDLESLGKICDERNLYLVVNATQSIGSLNFDVNKFGVHFTVANGHKWLLSSFGIGTLYIQGKLLDKESGMYPTFYSQFGQKNREHFDNTKIRMSKNASRFELSTPHFPNIIALRAAIKYISGINILRIEERIHHLTQYLIDRLGELKIQILSPLANTHRSAIVVFKSRSPNHLVAYLGKRRIIVSARGGGIRIAPHFYNNEIDIDRLILALKAYHA
ncbi:MAG TPA: aminotransferase class V-fold PLP-dependent enzyme [Nitrososphaeraceae archaeon]|nr:aminotransferase class V-fold PLP-dependent enzyme [Nitrososphaeraceae archaeon]